MNQQINLYQPIFRAEQRYFSARAIGWSYGLFLAGLVAFSVITWWRIGSLEGDLRQLRGQTDNQKALNDKATRALANGETRPAIEQRVADLALQLEQRQKALRFLTSGQAGERHGFAERIAALARQHVDGLWLTGATLTSIHGQLALSGVALNPDLVPRYLQGLTAEPTLAGSQLDQFEISTPKELATGVRFTVSSASMAPEDKPAPALLAKANTG